MVLIIHANYMGLGFPSQLNAINDSLTVLGRIYIEHLCIICVNVFILISGWFGITPKTKSFISFVVQIFTYSLIIYLIAIFRNETTFSREGLENVLIVGSQYWFIVSYLLLYLLSPVLNEFINHSNPHTIKKVLFCYFCFEFIYGWYHRNEGFIAGYSFLSFAGLYLLARYLHNYSPKICKYNSTKLLITYLLVTFCTALRVWYSLRNDNPVVSQDILILYISYDSPFVVLSSVLMLIIFTKISFKNKIINYISKSSLAVYLIHVNPFLWPKYLGIFPPIFLAHSSTIGVLITISIIIGVFFSCIIIEKIRLLITPINLILKIIDRIKALIRQCAISMNLL